MTTGSDSTQSTVKQGPPDYLKPNIQQLSADAKALYNRGGPNPYPVSTVANSSPETLQGWQSTAARAVNGSPVNSAADSYLTNTINGGFLTNPYGGQVFQDIADRVTPQVNAQFSLAGRYGSGAQTDQLTRSLTDAYAPFAAQQYATERGNQQQAAGMAPTAANQDYTDLAALQGVGTARDAYGQSLMTDNATRYAQAQQQPYNNANWLASILYGNPAQQSTTTTPAPSTGIGGFLGGLLGGIL